MNAIMACIGGRAPPGQKKRSPYAGSRWPNGARGSPPPGAGAWRPCPWSGQACARCLARPCQPIDAASAPCSRSSRQSKSPSPTARNDPSRARKQAEPQACALPAKIGSVSCSPSLHLLKVRSLRQTRSGSWSNFGMILGGRQRVQAICDFVHAKIRFSYPDARPTRCASDSMHEGIGVCRDFAHLAIALWRCMNIPARYCTDYLGDIGVPVDPNPMDFSAWFEAFVDGRWYTMDSRHNHPRIGRIVMGRGRDAADVAMSTAFGVANLAG